MSYKEEALHFIEASVKLDSCSASGGSKPSQNKGGVCIPLTKSNTRGWKGYFCKCILERGEPTDPLAAIMTTAKWSTFIFST
jgi:hypothetical protein